MINELKVVESERVKSLMSAVDATSPTDAILKCVNKIRRENYANDDPVDVWDLVKRLGIKVNEIDLSSPGFILRHPGNNFEIQMDEGMDIKRKTFTLAHEIGHYLFYKNTPEAMGDANLNDHDPLEEILCNLAAAELLMPLRKIKTDLKREKYCPETVFELANIYGVSIEAMLRRLTKALEIVNGTRVASVMWHFDGRRFHPDGLNTKAKMQVIMRGSESCVVKAYKGKSASGKNEKIVVDNKKLVVNICAWRFGEMDKVLAIYWKSKSAGVNSFLGI